MRSIPKKQFLIWLFVTVATILYFWFSYKTNDQKIISMNYSVILICFVVCSVTFLILALNHNLHLFEPVVIVTGIYYFMFVYYPLRDINNGETSFFGQNFTSGAIKATVIVTISYIALLIGYYFNNSYHFENENQVFIEKNEQNQTSIYLISVILWLVGTIANFIYIMSSGKSILYILSLGSNGVANSELSSSSPLGFVGMFGFLMVGSMIYIFEYSNSRFFKVIAFSLTLLLFWMRGFRFIIVVIIVAPIIMHYLKERKQPTIFAMTVLIVGLLAMITIVGAFRNDIRNGTSNTSMSDISIESVDQSLYDNFGQYRPFYIMVEEIPDNYPHTYGVKTFVNPIIMFVPRIIWSGKNFLGMESNNFLSQAAQTAGTAYCNIGEYYMDFGMIGCVVLMFLLGKILGRTKKYVNGDIVSTHSYIAYSIIVPLVMQIIIRGYMASNFNLIIFSLLPVWIAKYVDYY